MTPQIAFVAREIFPFDAGGLGTYVTATAEILSTQAEVVIVTTERHRNRYVELRQQGSRLLPPESVHFEFIPEPDPAEGGWLEPHHAWSANAYRALRTLFPGGGPNLVEFPDYLGEGAVTVQAKRTDDSSLRNTQVSVRLYTTGEMASILNGYIPQDQASQVLFNLERLALKYADVVLWPGGDVLDTYRRFYGVSGLANARQIRHPFLMDEGRLGATAAFLPHGASGPRVLYVGRLERRKGVHHLVEAFKMVSGSDWSLTLMGGDTQTAPVGASMQDYLTLAVSGDERIGFLPKQDRATVVRLMAEADLVVSPSLWECWPNTVLEAMYAGCPVVATPVGGHMDLVRPGINGWLAGSTDPEALARVFDFLLEEPSELARIRDANGPRRVFDELTNVDQIRAEYLSAAGKRPDERRTRNWNRHALHTGKPLVSIIIPYFELEWTIEATVTSALEQTWQPTEIILVNDGSLRNEDRVLTNLASRGSVTVLTQINAGLGAARNFGIQQSKGQYVVPLDADDVLAPEFVTRSVAALEARPDIAYVTSWLDYMDATGTLMHGSGYRPLWNETELLETINVAGSAVALFRRSVFDRGFWYDSEMPSYEDWLLYRDLRDAGLRGLVIPEQLIRYRIRDGSMARSVAHVYHDRLLEEMYTHTRYQALRWTAASV